MQNYKEYITQPTDITFDELKFIKELLLSGGKLDEILYRLYPERTIYRQYDIDRIMGTITWEEYYFTWDHANYRIRMNAPKSPVSDKEKIESFKIHEIQTKDFKARERIYNKLLNIFTVLFDDVGIKKTSGKWGFINLKGDTVIDFKYKDTFSFREGLAMVSENNQDYGFINKHGLYEIKPAFNSAIDLMSGWYDGFYNGYAKVAKCDFNNKKIGYINKKGELVIDFIYDNGTSLSEGLLSVSRPMIKDGIKTSLWGYINPTGRTVIDFIFESAGTFNNNRAMVVYEGKLQYIQKTLVGFAFIDTMVKDSYRKYLSQDPYLYGDDDLIPFKVSWNVYGYKNKLGRIIIPELSGSGEGHYDYDNGFMPAYHQGYFCIFDNNGKYHKVIPSQEVSSYTKVVNDIIAIQISSTGKWGFFNSNGEEIVKSRFSNVKVFSEGLAAVKEENEYEFLVRIQN